MLWSRSTQWRKLVTFYYWNILACRMYMWDTLCPCWILWGNREWLQIRGSVIKSTPVLWRAGCSRGQEKAALLVSRPSAPPAGRSEECIWPRRRRGRPLFSSAPWRSGAKIADSSSIHTGSHSTHSPVRHRERERPEHRWEARTKGEHLQFICKKRHLLI